MTNRKYPNGPDGFWCRVHKAGADECWEWVGYKIHNGYGFLYWNGDKILAHRLAWTLTNGQVPETLYVCHHCDNRLCCNPEHLFLGTHTDNMRDMVAKGRRVGPSGETHPARKNPLRLFTNMPRMQRILAGWTDYQRTAAEHRQADKRMGRAWVCQCAACRQTRRDRSERRTLRRLAREGKGPPDAA